MENNKKVKFNVGYEVFEGDEMLARDTMGTIFSLEETLTTLVKDNGAEWFADIKNDLRIKPVLLYQHPEDNHGYPIMFDLNNGAMGVNAKLEEDIHFDDSDGWNTSEVYVVNAGDSDRDEEEFQSLDEVFAHIRGLIQSGDLDSSEVDTVDIKRVETVPLSVEVETEHRIELEFMEEAFPLHRTFEEGLMPYGEVEPASYAVDVSKPHLKDLPYTCLVALHDAVYKEMMSRRVPAKEEEEN